jgi:hypothetical protein
LSFVLIQQQQHDVKPANSGGSKDLDHGCCSLPQFCAAAALEHTATDTSLQIRVPHSQHTPHQNAENMPQESLVCMDCDTTKHSSEAAPPGPPAEEGSR